MRTARRADRLRAWASRNWLPIGATAATLWLALLAVGGTFRLSGKVLFTVYGTHGVHVGDIPVVLLAGLTLVALWRPRART